jgi:capsular polysaccharide biosynthesis protein
VATETETVEIDLRKVALALARRWWAIAAAAAVGCALALGATRVLMAPQYTATIKLYANNAAEATKTITAGDITASKSLVETYIAIIRSDTVLDEVLAKTGAGRTRAELDGMLSAGSLNSTEVFYVAATGPDAGEAAALANAVADIAPGRLAEIVDGSSVKVVDRAKTPELPSSPSYPKNAAAGAAAGLLLACGALGAAAALDVRVAAEEDLAALADIPVLGTVTDFGSAGKAGYGRYAASGAQAEGKAAAG